mmetsp:Transcript_82572/g.234202  ORF Transcript_82572/g.234202 Transcript_82572/m.234202 type:complete len:555 (+) Transcript_82572:531-2195(+)
MHPHRNLVAVADPADDDEYVADARPEGDHPQGAPVGRHRRRADALDRFARRPRRPRRRPPRGSRRGAVMSSILVDFEVLPEASRTELTAVQVYDELKRQIADPHSLLWNGDFGRYAAKAELRPSSGDVGGDTLRSARSSHGPDEFGEATAGAYSRSQPASAGGAFPSQGHWPQQGPGSHHDAPGELPSRFNSNDWQGAGLSGSEAVDRFDYFERQLKKTAAGGYRPQDLPTPAANARGHNGSGGSVEVEALEEKSIHLQHRLEVVERELRDALEASRMHRAKAEQAELKLKDREQLLVHAKEMWMKENVRASKLADALTSAEDKLADTEKRLGEVTSRYNEAQQEVRQLQHVLGAPRENGFGGDSRKLDFIPKTASPTNFAKVGRSPSNFDDPFRDDVPGGGGGGMVRPSTAMGIETLDGGKSLPMPPLEAETNADRFNRLCLLNDAVLYEDELLQIGIKGEYAGRDGQVAVYFGNKSSASLEAFTVQYFVREEEAHRLSTTPIDSAPSSSPWEPCSSRVCFPTTGRSWTTRAGSTGTWASSSSASSACPRSPS